MHILLYVPDNQVTNNFIPLNCRHSHPGFASLMTGALCLSPRYIGSVFGQQ